MLLILRSHCNIGLLALKSPILVTLARFILVALPPFFVVQFFIQLSQLFSPFYRMSFSLSGIFQSLRGNILPKCPKCIKHCFAISDVIFGTVLYRSSPLRLFYFFKNHHLLILFLLFLSPLFGFIFSTFGSVGFYSFLVWSHTIVVPLHAVYQFCHLDICSIFLMRPSRFFLHFGGFDFVAVLRELLFSFSQL